MMWVLSILCLIVGFGFGVGYSNPLNDYWFIHARERKLKEKITNLQAEIWQEKRKRNALKYEVWKSRIKRKASP